MRPIFKLFKYSDFVYIVRKAMKFVQLKSMKDLVMLVASSPTMNVIQHLEYSGTHLYFIIGGTLTEIFLYFVKEREQVKGSFLTYNSYSGEIGTSERIMQEPNVSSFPVVEILNQDLLPGELLAQVGGL